MALLARLGQAASELRALRDAAARGDALSDADAALPSGLEGVLQPEGAAGVRDELQQMDARDVESAHACWEQASEAVVALCERGGALARQSCFLQAADALLRMGLQLQGAAPGSRSLPTASAASTCEAPVILPEDRGLLKMVVRLLPLARVSSADSIAQLQVLADKECSKEALAGPVSALFVNTLFVVNACRGVLFHPEENGLARHSSLQGVAGKLLECCCAVLNAALNLGSIVRKLQAVQSGHDYMEPLQSTYEEAMALVQDLAAWLADAYIADLRDQLSASSHGMTHEYLLAERQAFGAVLSQLAHVATTHTVQLKPGVINVIYKVLIKVLEMSAPVMPSPGFWTASFDGQALAGAMIGVVEGSFRDLVLLSHGEDGTKQLKLIRFMLQHLASILRLAPQALVPVDALGGMLNLFARIKSLVPPCYAYSQLDPNTRQEVAVHVSPLLDTLMHSLLTSNSLQPARRQELIEHLCCRCRSSLPSGPAIAQACVAGDKVVTETDMELCDLAAGRLALVHSVLQHIGNHPQDVQQAFVDRMPDLFDLVQVAAPHCVACPESKTARAEEDADLLFRCCMMFSAMLSAGPGKIRSEALRVVVAQVISGAGGELSQIVAVHVWGLQLRNLLPVAAVVQHAKQLAMLLREASCRGVVPYCRLQGHFAHLLVTAIPAAPQIVELTIDPLLEPANALRSDKEMGMATALLHALRNHLEHMAARDLTQSKPDEACGDKVVRSLVSRCCPSLLSSALRECQQMLMLEPDHRRGQQRDADCVDGWQLVGLMSVAGGALGASLELEPEYVRGSSTGTAPIDALSLCAVAMEIKELVRVLPIVGSILLLATVSIEAIKRTTSSNAGSEGSTAVLHVQGILSAMSDLCLSAPALPAHTGLYATLYSELCSFLVQCSDLLPETATRSARTVLSQKVSLLWDYLFRLDDAVAHVYVVQSFKRFLAYTTLASNGVDVVEQSVPLDCKAELAALLRGQTDTDTTCTLPCSRWMAVFFSSGKAQARRNERLQQYRMLGAAKPVSAAHAAGSARGCLETLAGNWAAVERDCSAMERLLPRLVAAVQQERPSPELKTRLLALADNLEHMKGALLAI